jgi:lipoyl(octanoyl) transferase
MEKQNVIFSDLGVMEYQQAWDLQEKLLKENVQVKVEFRSRETEDSLQSTGIQTSDFGHPTKSDKQTTTNHLLFVEHPAVYTLGKSGQIKNVLLNNEQLDERHIQFFHTNRGGDITFHGPGQIVGYPIIDLENFYTDIGRYLRELEEVIILTLAEYGIMGERSPGETGVWIDPFIKGKERKICAMGVRCSRWITMHGFALNVNTDLSYFNFIVPCGIQNKQVTSLEKEAGGKIDITQIKEKIRKNFEKVFGCNIIMQNEWNENDPVKVPKNLSV